MKKLMFTTQSITLDLECSVCHNNAPNVSYILQDLKPYCLPCWTKKYPKLAKQASIFFSWVYRQSLDIKTLNDNPAKYGAPLNTP